TLLLLQIGVVPRDKISWPSCIIKVPKNLSTSTGTGDLIIFFPREFLSVFPAFSMSKAMILNI
ncbi:hypothetical protein ACSYAD_36735, partial [Acaryochloris marina NIES-2412]|uniref:hypothetical protein n=1 Tax=Acaryochloris marina TaxID=155978 RepID=UPI004057D0C9